MRRTIQFLSLRWACAPWNQRWRASTQSSRLPPLLSAEVGVSCQHAHAISSSPRPQCSPSAESIGEERHRWLSKLIYGTAHAPLFGLTLPSLSCCPPSTSTDAASGEADHHPHHSTRRLYCKALIAATGGHRHARNYVAGFAAAATPGCSYASELIDLALHHPVDDRAGDLQRLRDHFLAAWCDEEEARQQSAAATPLSSFLSMNRRRRVRGGARVDEDEFHFRSLEEAECLLLSSSSVVRCFMYDVMTAVLFRRNDNVEMVLAAERDLILLGREVFGMSEKVLLTMWKLTLEEGHLTNEKLALMASSSE